MKDYGKILAGVSMMLVLGWVGVAAAAKPPEPPTIDVTITKEVSDAGVTPSVVGNNWRYDYEIVAQDAINDSLSFEICSTTSGHGEVDYDGYPLTLTIGPNGEGGNLPGVSYPATVTIVGDSCQHVSVELETGALDKGNYNRLLKFALVRNKDEESKGSFDTNNIHIQVKVTAAESAITCFITDSSFNFLAACDGSLITSGNDGRFAIVTNKKGKQVATNPGQFYYNLLWTNASDSDQTVDVTFDRDGVFPQGAQAIHAEVFPAFPIFDSINFEEVNAAIPGGSDDVIGEIMVPAGATLWVDYHLEWAELGTNTPVFGNTCDEAGSDFSVTATVTAGGTDYTCGAGASGYKK